MPTREQNRLLSFRRTFTLLILLVVVPSAAVSSFGIIAIVNERALVEKRLEAAWATRMELTINALDALLKTVSVSNEAPLSLTVGPHVLEGPGFRVVDGAVDAADARVAGILGVMGPRWSTLPERPLVFSVSAPQGTAVFAARRSGNVVQGLEVPVTLMETLVREVGSKELTAESASWHFLPIKPDAPDGVMARVVTEARQTLGSRELSSRVMPAPLQDFRLVAIAEGEDPVAEASYRNRVIYVVLLGLFYLALVTGVIFTGRTLARDARLSRLKTDFVSLVSHELRTPLTSIRMFIEMLATNRVKDDGEKQKVLDLLSKETTRLSGMIENVLDWARIESGKKTYELTRVDVKTVVDSAVSAFRAQRVGAVMDFTVDCPENTLFVSVDSESIASSLLNLLQNAFKYTGAEKKIVLRVVRSGSSVVIEVEDNGRGIARREYKRIFERFYRVDALLTRETEGSGLGLAIAQRIVQSHHGRISVDSKVGKGSTFRIHLPAV